MRKQHDLKTPEGRLANMLDFYTEDRQRAEQAHLWFEVRYWAALPEGHHGTPSHWAPVCYAGSLSMAGIVADALWRSAGWYCEVWTCNPVVDPDIPPASSDPVPWHMCDVCPSRTYPHDWPDRPASGNPGEQVRRQG